MSWYDSVADTLYDLNYSHGFSLSVITNKPSLPTNLIINDAGLRPLFSYIIGIDYRSAVGLGCAFDSKSAAINYTLKLARCSPDQAIYVGDTRSDQQAATENSIQFIPATYGFYQWSEHELVGQTPLRRFADLPSLLRTLGILKSAPPKFIH
jgi:phosphoglycolate phosphatase